VDPKSVCALAKKGDEAAQAAISEAAHYLGIAIGNIVNALNPDLVVIGGGLAGAGETILGPIRAATMPNILPPLRKHVRIVRAKLGNSAGVIGAASWAMSRDR
jgi:glucokinase